MTFSNPQQVRIVIADDHSLFRDGLRRLLESEANFKVVGEASDGAKAVQLARELKPDILLLDLAMPKHPGLDALQELSIPTNASPVRVILLAAAVVDRRQIVEALQLGARGVVLKDSATQLLLKAIQSVMIGEYWVGAESFSNRLEYLRMLVQSSVLERRKAEEFGLTPREFEVVADLVAGYSNHEIALHLNIAEATVKLRLCNIFDKLGVSSSFELALIAAHWFGGSEDGDTAGFAVKKPRNPNLNSGSAAADPDDEAG